ncbi:MAG: ABC transporter ATP-binding protein [Gammaproteobacteria bacterium]
MSLLSIRAINKNFGGLWALKNVSFDVQAGRIHGLMGANGAGKTTLFSIVAGNLRASSGRVLFDGETIDTLRPDQVCRRGLARTFQIVRPFPAMTVQQNVETAILFGRNRPPSMSRAAELAGDVLEQTALAAQAHKPAATLTLAGRKRLELARALGTEPRLLLLDEVMAGLTPVEVQEMMATIVRIKQRYELTVLIIEHVVGALTGLSDWITVLHHGECIAEGPPATIAGNAAVLTAYFGTGQA